MEYRGKFQAFDSRKISTYPINERANKVSLNDLIDPASVLAMDLKIGAAAEGDLDRLAQMLIGFRKSGLPVILFTGAHLIKNGLGLLLRDLVERKLVTCVAGNMATAIHDFELAYVANQFIVWLTSQSSPDPDLVDSLADTISTIEYYLES